MARAEGPAQGNAQHGRFDEGQRHARVQILLGGSKDKVNARAVAYFEIGIPSSRVASQVLVRIELERIHENAGNYHIVLAPGSVQQSDVSGVQRAHGWNQPNGKASTADFGEPSAELNRLRDYFWH